MQWAEAQEGKPYKWGATGPDAYDCSGLVYAAYQANGVAVKRTSQGQQSEATKIDSASLALADLCFVGTPAYHVAMYAGNGSIVVADHTGIPVRTRPLDPSEFTGGFGRILTGSETPITTTGFTIPNPLSPFLFVEGLYNGVSAVADHVTDPNWWRRLGKGAAGLGVAGAGLITMMKGGVL